MKRLLLILLVIIPFKTENARVDLPAEFYLTKVGKNVYKDKKDIFLNLNRQERRRVMNELDHKDYE